MGFPRSKRGEVASFSTSLNMKAKELEAQGQKIIHLHIGAPSTGAPQAAIEAATKAEQDNILGYTGAAGLPELRERIAQDYQARYGVSVDPKRVVMAVGASMALVVAALACLDKGEKFCLPYPLYPAYQNTLELLDIEPVGLPTKAENGFQISVDDIDALAGDVKAIIIASPSNPAGTVIAEADFKAVIERCEARGIQLISDEIYHGIVYDGASCETALKFSENVIVINSFSKYYSMPGWRLGWMVLPEDLVERSCKITRNLYLAAPTPSQYAAIAAMDCRDELDKHLIRYKKNRDLLLSEMPKAGFDKFLEPQGAFYFYAHVAHLHTDSKEFCMELLEKTGITAMPGSAFDPENGHQYMRFSYAGSTEAIEEAVDRLKKWRSDS